MNRSPRVPVFNRGWLKCCMASQFWQNRGNRKQRSATGIYCIEEIVYWQFGLTDTWRMMNPSSRESSFFSACHKSFSRIYFIFASKTLFNDMCSTEMTPIALSDHRAVLCSFSLRAGQSRAVRWRFNTSLLQNDTLRRELEADLEEFIKINGPSVDDPRVLWDAVTGCIRNTTIYFASNLNKSKNHCINCLESEIAALEQEMLSNTSPENICKKLFDELKGVVRNFGHRTWFPSQPVCYLSLETFSTNFMQSF